MIEIKLTKNIQETQALIQKLTKDLCTFCVEVQICRKSIEIHNVQ
jgi:hypothetical protein